MGLVCLLGQEDNATLLTGLDADSLEKWSDSLAGAGTFTSAQLAKAYLVGNETLILCSISQSS